MNMNYMKLALLYVDKTCRNQNFKSMEEFENYFNSDLDHDYGELLEQEYTTGQAKRLVQENSKYVFEALTEYTDVSYEGLWDIMINENWEYLNHIALRKALADTRDLKISKHFDGNNMILDNDTLVDIIDVFEDYLDEKGIDISNSEKIGLEGEANIYGSEFLNMMEKIRDVLKVNGIKIPDKWGK